MQDASTEKTLFLSPFVINVTLITLPLLILVPGDPAKSQIIPEPNSTNTTVSPNGNRLDIGGGRTSQDGANLFHSFDRFNVNQGQIANFLSNPQIRNILSRFVGGEASIINGLIQVTGGNSNLFLMNPAGIIFGSQASLNVPGSFFATTATGIGFNGNSWFSAIANNNYDTLVGNPNVFAFTNLQPGAIINAGNLAVPEGQTLGLLGGTVINTGQLTAPEGQITVMAVPGENLVRLSQAGSLLSLEIQPLSTSETQPNNFNLEIPSLPQLLTGGKAVNATQVTVNNDGTISLSGSGLRISPETGTAIASGKINTSGETGGNVQILGSKVGIINAEINVSGINGGGTALIGGDFQGKGKVPNSINTYVSKDSVINADSLVDGKGGTVVVWADKSTQFYGKISAVGGSKSGDGGFVEVSGKENLTFDGSIDVFAVNGEKGQVLFDPKSVIIGTDGTNDDELSDGIILASDGADDEIFYISASKLLEVLDSGNVAIAATENIDVEEPVDASSNTNANNLDLTAPIVNINAAITLKGDLTVKATNKLNVNSAISTFPGNGNINLLAGIGTLTTKENGTIKAGTGDINLIANKIEINASISGTGNLILQPKSANQSIGIGDVAEGNFNIDASEINQLQDGFASITIGSDTGSGKVNITSITFKDPVTIQSPNNSIITDGTITGTDNAAITLIAKSVELGGDIITSDSNIEFKNSPVTLKSDVTLKAGKGVISFSKEVDATDKELNLIADEIDFLGGNASVTGTGKIALQPGTSELDIVIGGTSNSELSLDITKNDIAALKNGFEYIIIGGIDTSGAIKIVNDITFIDPLTIQSPKGSGTITATGIIKGNNDASITLLAKNDITTNKITTDGKEISLTSSNGTITTDKLTTNASSGDGGNVTLKATGTIKTGEIEVNSYFGAGPGTPKGGDIIIESEADIITGAIDTKGQYLSGNINLKATGKVNVGKLISSSIYDKGGNLIIEAGTDIITQSIDTSGEYQGGEVNLKAAGNIQIGELQTASISGSAGKVNIEAGNNVDTVDINTMGGFIYFIDNGFKGGEITIKAAGNVKTGDIYADSDLGTGGNITFEAGNLIVGNINTNTKQGDAGSVKLSATADGGDIVVGDIKTSVLASGSNGAKSGAINVIAKDSIKAGKIDTSVNFDLSVDNGAAITFNAGGAVEIQDIQQSTNLNISAGSIKTGIIDTSNSVRVLDDDEQPKYQGGSVTLLAKGDIEVKYINASGDKGGNIDIQTDGIFRATGFQPRLAEDFFEITANDPDPEHQAIIEFIKQQTGLAESDLIGKNVSIQRGFIPTSISSSVVSPSEFGGSKGGGGSINIKHGSQAFVVGPKFIGTKDDISFSQSETSFSINIDQSKYQPITASDVGSQDSFTAGTIGSNTEYAQIAVTYIDNTFTKNTQLNRVQITFPSPVVTNPNPGTPVVNNPEPVPSTPVPTTPVATNPEPVPSTPVPTTPVATNPEPVPSTPVPTTPVATNPEPVPSTPVPTTPVATNPEPVPSTPVPTTPVATNPEPVPSTPVPTTPVATNPEPVPSTPVPTTPVATNPEPGTTTTVGSNQGTEVALNPTRGENRSNTNSQVEAPRLEQETNQAFRQQTPEQFTDVCQKPREQSGSENGQNDRTQEESCFYEQFVLGKDDAGLLQGLLTNGKVGNANQMRINEQGEVELTGSGIRIDK